MFDFVRTHQRIIQILLLLLIIPSFLFFGVESFMRTSEGAADIVAEVNGQKITQQEWDVASRDYLKRAGDKAQDSPYLRYAILDDLLNQYAINNEVNRLGLTASDEQLRKIILEDGKLTNPDGSINRERYIALLAQIDMTPASYEARLRKDLANQKLTQTLRSSGLITSAHAGLLADQFDQERVVKEALFLSNDYVNKVNLNAAQLQDFYATSGTQFNTPETVDVEYLVLNKTDRAAKIPVTEAQIEADYKANTAQFMAQEQRRARHILIAFPEGATPDEKVIATTRQKAEKVRAELQKKGAKFELIAQKYSDDPGSAKLGGELSWFGRGAMVKNFEDAAFSQAKGVIGPLVPTEYGFHIIEVEEIRQPGIQPLAEVRAQIESKLRDAAASKTFTADTELFTNMVYEQSDNLKATADKFGLSIQTAKGVMPTHSPLPALNSPRLLTALFTKDSLTQKRNTEAVEVSPGVWVSARIVAHQASQKKPFAEVESQIRDLLTQQEARKLAIAAGQAALANLKKQGTQNNLTMVEKVYSRTAKNLPPDLVNAVMKATITKLPEDLGAEYSQGYAVMQLIAIRVPTTSDAAARTSQINVLRDFYASQQYRLAIDELRRSFKAQIKVAKPS